MQQKFFAQTFYGVILAEDVTDRGMRSGRSWKL